MTPNSAMGGMADLADGALTMGQPEPRVQWVWPRPPSSVSGAAVTFVVSHA